MLAVSVLKASSGIVQTPMKNEHRDYEFLLENAPDATIMIDGSGTIRYINLQAERLFLYNRTELIGQRLEVLIPERYRGVHESHRANFAKAPRFRMMGVHMRHLVGLRKDGREFPAEISLSPLPDEFVLAGIRERFRGSEEARVAFRQMLPSLIFLVLALQAVVASILYFLLR